MESVFVECQNNNAFGVKHFHSVDNFERWLRRNGFAFLLSDVLVLEDGVRKYKIGNETFVVKPVVWEEDPPGMVEVAEAVYALNARRFNRKYWQRKPSLRKILEKEAREAIKKFVSENSDHIKDDAFLDLWLAVVGFRISRITDGGYAQCFGVHIPDWRLYVESSEMWECLNTLRHYGKVESDYEIMIALIALTIKLGHTQESVSEALLEHIEFDKAN